jgi:hypothetical protein
VARKASRGKEASWKPRRRQWLSKPIPQAALCLRVPGIAGRHLAGERRLARDDEAGGGASVGPSGAECAQVGFSSAAWRESLRQLGAGEGLASGPRLILHRTKTAQPTQRWCQLLAQKIAKKTPNLAFCVYSAGSLTFSGRASGVPCVSHMRDIQAGQLRRPGLSISLGITKELETLSIRGP